MTIEKDEAEKLISKWLDLDFWPITRGKALELLASELYTQILIDFDPQNRIELSSHGLQGEYGPGFNKLNEVVVAQTAQSIYYYCLRVIGETELKMHGVGIGYDWSPHAEDFARISAAVFLLHGVRVYMVSEPVSASYVGYLNKYYMCGCGFMATETHISHTEYQYVIYGIGYGSTLTAPHSTNVSEMISADNSHIFVPHSGLQSLEKVLEKGLESRLLIMIDQEHEVSKAYHGDLKLLKYFSREYRKRMRTSFRIGCFLLGMHDRCKVISILQNLFQFSTDAIQSRFVFFEDTQPGLTSPEKCISVACDKADAINSCITADRAPPIKIVMCIDINAEAICLAELIESSTGGCQPQWCIHDRDDINAFAANWCVENLNGNPTVLARLKEHRAKYDRGMYVHDHSIRTSSPHFEVARYDGTAHIDSSKEDKEERKCGAVCACYQGFQRSVHKVTTARDGAILLGILAELIIDLYEFSGSGISIKKSANEKLDSNTLGEYINIFTESITS